MTMPYAILLAQTVIGSALSIGRRSGRHQASLIVERQAGRYRPGKAPADRACRGHHSTDARPSRNPSEPHSADPVIDPQTTAVGIERRTDDHVKAALLDAADMIRILRIILDGKE